MTSRVSRLLSLYGLFLLMCGALGLLSDTASEQLPSGLMAAVGAASVICSSMLKKEEASAFAAAPLIVAAGLLVSVWFALHGWIGVAADKSGIFFATVLFTMTALFSTMLLPTLVRTWKLRQRLYKLFDPGE